MSVSFDRTHKGTTYAMIGAIVLLIASLGFSRFVKPPSKDYDKDFRTKSFAAEKAVKQDRAQTALLQAQNDTETWIGSGADIEPVALNLVSNLAYKHGVKLTGFRLQRQVNSGDLTQIPFLVNVDGSFSNVMAMEKDIEKPSSKMAVENIQLGSSDESTDQVTGTMSVETYVVNGEGAASSTSKTVSKSTSKTAAVKEGSKGKASKSEKGAEPEVKVKPVGEANGKS